MKYLGLLISIVLVSSCAATMQKTGYERQNECKVKLYNQYWEDCYIEITESDPAFEQQVKKSVGFDRWNLLKLQSKDLKTAVDNKTMSKFDANNRFAAILADLDRIEEKKKADRAKAWQDLADALNEANNNASGRGSTNNQSSGMMYTLSDDYVSGMNRICIYKLGSLTATHTMNGIGLCPITKNF